MRINNQNKQNLNFSGIATKALGQFYNANATIPTLIIETGVTLGRAHEANKRGGKPEAIDRLVEQGVSAIVWVYGVKILKSIGDLIGKSIFKIKDLNFDIGFDKLRNPTKYIDKKALNFKAGNILTSTALATYFIGAILPKINKAILKKTLKKQEEAKTTTLKAESFDEFKEKTAISFKGLINAAHVLENNSTARLFITDTGVIAGRFANAPNKYRKIEGLFRDIASIYFYLGATKDIVKILNGKSNANINPKTLDKTVELLIEKLKENPNLSNEEFYDLAVKKADVGSLKELFKDKKVISVDDFIKKFPDFADKAKSMAKLQFIESGNGILSFEQASDVLSNAWVSNPKFLKETYDDTIGKNIADKLTFVSSKDLNETRTSIDNFVKQIFNSAQKNSIKIDEDFIKKIAKTNVRKNLAFNIIGTLISTYALGILIPKVQYAITKKLSHEDKFHTEEG